MRICFWASRPGAPPDAVELPPPGAIRAENGWFRTGCQGKSREAKIGLFLTTAIRLGFQRLVKGIRNAPLPTNTDQYNPIMAAT